MSESYTDPSQAQKPQIPKLFMHATASSSSGSKDDDSSTTKLPNGVVLGKDGKPCRLCTSAASWRALTKQAKAAPASAPTSSSTSLPTSTTVASTTAASAAVLPPSSTQNECPPDVEELGRSTWTFLHSLTAAYPEKATPEQQTEMQSFMTLFSRLYPCWVCADDLRTWMAEPSGRNKPRLAGRSDFGNWMCEAHNEVNRKLGKKEFDCRFWEERWRTGWKDGRCD